jgi:Fe-S-cluster formation regulator IscX/YfhJ
VLSWQDQKTRDTSAVCVLDSASGEKFFHSFADPKFVQVVQFRKICEAPEQFDEDHACGPGFLKLTLGVKEPENDDDIFFKVFKHPKLVESRRPSDRIAV